jgi:hypothetical protein
MAGKSINYWRNQYKHARSKRNGCQDLVDDGTLPKDGLEFSTIYDLLCQYSSTVRSPIFGVYAGNAWSRFWAGRWGTNHGNEVKKALVEADEFLPKERSVANLIGVLKRALGNKVLKPDGDLSRILQVIEEKTGVSLSNAENHMKSRRSIID